MMTEANDVTTYRELKKLQIQLGDFDIWVTHSPLALAIRFRAPNNKLVYKYSLSVENVQMGEEKRSCM